MLSNLRREFPLLLAAFIIAFTIWLIAKQSERETSWVSTPIRLMDVPENLDVQLRLNDPANIKVQFPREQLRRNMEQYFRVEIQVDDVVSGDPAQWGTEPRRPRTVNYKLSLANVDRASAPSDVQEVAIDPESVDLVVSLRLLEMQVVVTTTGELPSQYEMRSDPIPSPSTVLVTGPAHRLEALAEQGATIQTQPINLSEVTQTAQLFRELIVPEGVQLVDTAGSRVTIDIEVVDRPQETIFSGVPVTLTTVNPNFEAIVTPPTVDVVVEAPASVIAQLSRDSFAFTTASAVPEIPGQVHEVALQARLRQRLQQELGARVRRIEINPPRISVEFVERSGQDGAEDAPAPVIYEQ